MPSTGNPATTRKLCRVETTIVVHPNQDPIERRVFAPARAAQRECRALVIEPPAESIVFRMSRLKIQVDGAAKVDPANQSQPILIGERRDLDFLPAGPTAVPETAAGGGMILP